MTTHYFEFCVYCGDAFECRDHIVPVSMSHVFRTFKNCDCVSCCNQCNNLAGDFPARDLLHKSSYLLEKYVRLLAKDRTADWTAKEIAELDYTLRTLVQKRSLRKRLIQAKVRNLERTSVGLHPYPIHWNANKIQTLYRDLSELWEDLLAQTGVGKILLKQVSDEDELREEHPRERDAKAIERPRVRKSHRKTPETCIECRNEFERRDSNKICPACLIIKNSKDREEKIRKIEESFNDEKYKIVFPAPPKWRQNILDRMKIHPQP